MSDFYQVSRADLEAINRAMNHMGDVLNGMDAVEEEDEAATEAGFKAIQAILASHPSNAVQDAPDLSEIIRRKNAEIDALGIPMWTYATPDSRDARRYRRLQVLGAAPFGSDELEHGNVLRFTNLDAFVDGDITAHPSRGELAATVPQVVQAPVARVAVHKTGGNAGIAWSATPLEDAPLMRDGELLYAAPQPVAASPSIVPSDNGYGSYAESISYDMRPDTTASNAGEAAPAAIDVRDAQWQPIETAPHGETILLACEYSNGKGYVCIGHYIERFTEEDTSDENANVEYCEEKDTFYVRPGWYEHQYNWGDYSGIGINDKIVGWMPAPTYQSPPQTGKSDCDLCYGTGAHDETLGGSIPGITDATCPECCGQTGKESP